MIGCETALLTAVRNALRTEASYSDEQCNIEFDEMAPATAGDTYVVVLPGGASAADVHATSGGVRHVSFAVDVTVMKRIGHVPRDRTRNVFALNLDAINKEVDKIVPVVDWSYAVMDAANALVLAAYGISNAFIVPLRFSSIERRPRLIPGESFGDMPATPRPGMARTVSFTGAICLVNQ